jgi:hypothetical protein
MNDLRAALLRAGCREAAVDRVIADLEPAAAAIERTGRVIDADLAWVLVAVQADRVRRRGAADYSHQIKRRA